ncbi:hypothetical protein [Streptomyces hilarionis]|uniref:hypothetical protein n=1 Tax=Streptomyces hilarionis TaxID=2839954 RepID=UPI00211A509A|nr:hypothetical protein [Streptomyces hilarionis]MCQ9136324.1 hypothetical protein [Streptomyces hilarionis]
MEVTATPLAHQQISRLRGPDRQAFDQFKQGLKSEGCKHLGYRMTGEVVEHLCVKHLPRSLRVIVAFESRTAATVLLVGPHDDDPSIDVYTALYTLAGLDEVPAAPRTKPPCCTTRDPLPPTVDQDTLDRLINGARQVRGSQSRRTGGRRRGA